MSKKANITNELKKGTSVEDICTDLEVSTGYVYRIKREIEEFDRNKEEDIQSEDDNIDDMVVDTSGRVGSDVEENDKDMVKKEPEGETNKSDGVGGVKKRKKSTKKKVQKDEIEQDEQDEQGGLIKWIVKSKKKMLMILTALSLSIVLMWSFLQMKPKDPESIPIARYPILTN